MTATRVAIIGGGKIAAEQHIPAMRNDPFFELAGIVDPVARISGIPCYSDLATMLDATPVDAVSICTPPQVRFLLACAALDAGKHVLLEKPPCATVTALQELERRAQAQKRTLYTAWHSQHAPAVQVAREWLSSRQRIDSVVIEWCEDVRRWHPGQRWIWQPNGLGVFDPGINALSILSAILPNPVRLDTAKLEIPFNCCTPSAAELCGRIGASAAFSARFDFLQIGTQTWNIDIVAEEERITLSMGGACLTVGGQQVDVGECREYPSVYRRFAELIQAGKSEIDMQPLAIAEEALLMGQRVEVNAFVE